LDFYSHSYFCIVSIGDVEVWNTKLTSTRVTGFTNTLTDFSFTKGKQSENVCYNFKHQYKQGVTAKRRTYLWSDVLSKSVALWYAVPGMLRPPGTNKNVLLVLWSSDNFRPFWRLVLEIEHLAALQPSLFLPPLSVNMCLPYQLLN